MTARTMPDGLRVWFGGNLELLSNLLNCRQQKSDQNRDNSNIHYKNIHYKSVPPGHIISRKSRYVV